MFGIPPPDLVVVNKYIKISPSKSNSDLSMNIPLVLSGFTPSDLPSNNTNQRDD